MHHVHRDHRRHRLNLHRHQGIHRCRHYRYLNLHDCRLIHLHHHQWTDCQEYLLRHLRLGQISQCHHRRHHQVRQVRRWHHRHLHHLCQQFDCLYYDHHLGHRCLYNHLRHRHRCFCQCLEYCFYYRRRHYRQHRHHLHWHSCRLARQIQD